MKLVSRAAAIAAAILLFAPAAFALPKKGQPAPPLKATTLSGQEVTLSGYRGKVVLLDFFATWCHPCEDSIPEFVRLAAKYEKKGLRVLGLSLDDEGPKLVREFALHHHIDYPVALTNNDIIDDYGIRQLPVIYLIDRKGNVAERMIGFSADHTKILEAAIQRLLSEK